MFLKTAVFMNRYTIEFYIVKKITRFRNIYNYYFYIKQR